MRNKRLNINKTGKSSFIGKKVFNSNKLNKRGQVWIETVLYTLIGISLIGLVLAFITPKINEAKDNAVVEQTITSLNLFDEKMNAVLDVASNRRIVEFTIKRGNFYIYPNNDSIVFIIDDLTKPYSEPGVGISMGSINLVSTKGAKTNSVTMRIDYSKKANITYGSSDTNGQKFTPAAMAYKFSIENMGIKNGITNVDINEISGR